MEKGKTATIGSGLPSSGSRPPAVLEAILRNTESIGFRMASEEGTGSLLRALAASKPSGQFLELGTGTGVGTSWIVDGMDAASRLDSVDNDPAAVDVARTHLGCESRVTFHLSDGAEFLANAIPDSYDLVFADTWAGKFTHLDEALSLVRPGGMYVVDDLSPQANWGDDHPAKVEALVATLAGRPGFVATRLAWASGLMILVRIADR